jgi:cyanophycin synthetase
VEGDMTGPVAARAWCCATRSRRAVLETARGGLLRAGMGCAEVRRRRGAQRAEPTTSA